MKPRLLTINGETRSISDWARLRGMKNNTIAWRIDIMGWSPERAVFGERGATRLPQLLNHMGDPCVVCSARERGLTLQEIADTIGTSPTPVRLHTLHIKTPQQKAREASLALLQAGVPYREIQSRTGIFPSALAQMNRRLALSVRKIGRPRIAA